ncbi:unnamed protein product [Ostreobium quekettii]|uniref:protein-serine/threonine phosphatase n=1 Tax=Ostreobium quekettii TaxID=121088 RepID=A0A8S1IR65_9CHLO|nr:unnamed protein product [Ostreobium quekettii]|eukprot:evm.model.scf_289.2 EVM.evm.TU.scf_289.2   scf_289:13903-18532(+)
MGAGAADAALPPEGGGELSGQGFEDERSGGRPAPVGGKGAIEAGGPGGASAGGGAPMSAEAGTQSAPPDPSLLDNSSNRGKSMDGKDSAGQRQAGAEVPMMAVAAVRPELPVGSKNTQGRRATMEDACAVVDNLLEAPLCFRPSDRVVPPAVARMLAPLWAQPPTATGEVKASSDLDGDSEKGPDDGAERCIRRDTWFHFVGVYDGHGGQAVASDAAEHLHVFFKKAFQDAVLASADDGKPCDPPRLSSPTPRTRLSCDPLPDEERLNAVIAPNIDHGWLTDEGGWEPAVRVSSGSLAWSKGSSESMGCHPGLGLEGVAGAVKAAFGMMDQRLEAAQCAEAVGSTAVVALVSRWHVCVANCGDSRAVLSRNGAAYRMTRDHKPDLEDEQERIISCGGTVLNYNGKRVMGLLAMSRALGDHGLRDAGVISEPEVTIIARDKEDEFLVLATDGLWDTMSDKEVCDLARRCFQRAKERGAEPEMASRVAAGVLMKTALDRGSKDNITVTVVDLRPSSQP